MIGASVRSFLHLIAYIDAVPKRYGNRNTWRMSDLVELFEMFELPLAAPPGKSTTTIELLEIGTFPDDIAVFLFGATDRGASDPAFRNVDSGESRIVRKEPGEGISYSAHLAIDLRPTSSMGYRTRLESVPRVSRSAIARLINSTMEGDNDFHIKHPTGRDVRPKISFDGDMSAYLLESLKSGKLHRVDFARDQSEEEGAVGDSAMVPIEVTQSFKVRRVLPRSFSPLKAVQRLRKRASESGYETLRVQFTDTDTDKRHTIDLPLDSSQAKDVLYVKGSRHEFKSLESGPTSIVPAISKRLRKSLKEARGE